MLVLLLSDMVIYTITIVSEFSLFIQTKDETDYANQPNHRHQLLDPNFIVSEEYFQNIPAKSLVILDDFSFNKSGIKQTKADFLHIVNYHLRHRNIVLCIVIHNIYSSGLYHEILLSPHLFLAYSNLGYYVFKKLQQRLGGEASLSFWQEPVRFNYHFCYINCNKNYIINCVDQLFLGQSVKMFANGNTFLIHPDTQPCNPPEEIHNDNDNNKNALIAHDVKEYLTSVYPKNKNMYIVANVLLKNNLLDSTLFFVNTKNIHLADFCSYIMNKFDKPNTTNITLLKFCKQLQKMQIRFPKIVLKNPVAQKILS